MIDQLTIVFVSYNSGHLLLDRLEQLQTFPITVVDNNSHDGSAEIIKARFPDVKLIENDSNLGFGRAANLGIQSLNTPYALLLNPDVEANAQNINALVKEITNLTEKWLFLAPNTGMPPTPDKSKNASHLEHIRFASGCALLFNRQSFNELKGFDSNIFLFFEETDLCKRAEKQGYGMYYAKDIIFPHKEGSSVENVENLSAIKIWHYHWSRLYFCKKHGMWLALIKLLLKSLITYPIKQRLTSSEEKKLIYRMRHSAATSFTTGKSAFSHPSQAFIPDIQ